MRLENIINENEILGRELKWNLIGSVKRRTDDYEEKLFFTQFYPDWKIDVEEIEGEVFREAFSIFRWISVTWYFEESSEKPRKLFPNLNFQISRGSADFPGISHNFLLLKYCLNYLFNFPPPPKYLPSKNMHMKIISRCLLNYTKNIFFICGFPDCLQ